MKFALFALLYTSALAQIPGNAGADVAQAAATEAAQEVETYDRNVDADAKTLAKYDTMDAAAKTAWDTARKVITDARAKRDADEKTTVKFSEMTLDEQKHFSTGLLEFKKKTTTACLADAKAADCIQADALRAAQVTQRVADQYYAKTPSEMEAWNTAYAEEEKKLKATLIASAVEEVNKSEATQAASAVEDQNKTDDEDAKKLANYDTMDAAAKTAWDTARKVITDARAKRDADEKTTVKFSTMTLEEQTKYSADLLKWKKDTTELCKTSAKDIKCTKADAFRAAYAALYVKLSPDQAAVDSAYTEEQKNLQVSFEAAAKAEEEKATAAEKARLRTSGESCVAKDVKCAADHCCGTAKIAGKTTGDLTICHKSAEKTYKKGSQDYEFACTEGAMHLVASAAAILASSYML